MAIVKPKLEKRFKKMDALTPEKMKKIVSDIEKGSPYSIAAGANGLSEAHLYNLINQGEQDLRDGLDTDESRMVESLRRNEQKIIHRCLANIDPAEKSHRGAEWILERRFWKHFSPNVPAIELQKQLDEVQKLLAEKDKLKEG